ncbi:discoidin domain-containing protein [Streptomyces sp. NPDC054962]
MESPSAALSRRRLIQFLGTASALTALPLGAAGIPAAAAASMSVGPVAETYYRVLLDHTRWSESQWDATAGRYTAKDFGFAVVLGHAVLVTRGPYDADAAGIDRETLRARTVATLKHFAAANRLAGGSAWGRQLFWDTTFQSYFVLAARLLWQDLDETTRQHVDAIAREQAAYTTALGTGNDPASGGWTPNGLTGGYKGDTKLEEMGVYTQALAPGLAWGHNDPRHPTWRSAFGRWSRNEAGLPAADLANPATVDGVPVSDNTAQNLYDTFIVENHDSFGPHYQAELWRTSARNAAHFFAAGRPLPEVLTAQPNAGPLWRTLLGVMSDAGEPLMPMVDDREHLYGRDVIPLAFLAQVLGDRAAARCEAALAERLEAYQAYPPQNRLAKFSGEAKYEPEARAELAISYLLHEWRAGAPVQPLTSQELFAHASGATDYGTGPGLLSHQSPGAWAGTVTKPGFVKFAWQPGHDDWLFRISGKTPVFLPTTTLKVESRKVVTYHRLRDGFDGSASLLTLGKGFAGLATLPGGGIVYATSGTAPGEGHLEVHNLTMSGMPGLDGSRTYTTAEGTTTIAARDLDAPQPGGGRTDELTFPRGMYRHLRMRGVTPHPIYGYSLYAFEARDGKNGADLAGGSTATASSYDPGRDPKYSVDGDPASRWAVAKQERGRADSWFAVDLGVERQVDRVTLRWESAAGRAYLLQGSTDGTTWKNLVSWPVADLTSQGGWLAVDGRAGLIVRGASNPLAVYADTVVLSDGPAERLLVEGIPGASAKEVRIAADKPAPKAQPAAVAVSVTEGHLVSFNLSAEDVVSQTELPQNPDRLMLYAGVQIVTETGTRHSADLAAASARVEPPRFELRSAQDGAIPVGLRAEVVDGMTLLLSGPPCKVTVIGQGTSVKATVRKNRTTEVVLHEATGWPLSDAALGRPVFPTAPLPKGMSDPAAAVDGDKKTAWTPGQAGRMVVDLGAEQHVTEVVASWGPGKIAAARAEFSADGRIYQEMGELSVKGRTARLSTTGEARYVALSVPDWAKGHASLVALSLRAG